LILANAVENLVFVVCALRCEFLEYLASDMTEEEILDDFPDLTREDLKACIAFAADRERKLMTVPAA